MVLSNGNLLYTCVLYTVSEWVDNISEWLNMYLFLQGYKLQVTGLLFYFIFYLFYFRQPSTQRNRTLLRLALETVK